MSDLDSIYAEKRKVACGVALGAVGMREGPNYDHGCAAPTKYKANIISPWFGKTGFKHSAGCAMHWCAAFCSACAGYADKNVSGGERTFQRSAGARFLTGNKNAFYSKNIKDVRPGLVLIYSRDGGGHIHMCVSVSQSGFTTVGGNESTGGKHSGGSGAVVKKTWTWNSWQNDRGGAFIGIYKMWPESNESIANTQLGSISPIDTGAKEYSDSVKAASAESSEFSESSDSDTGSKQSEDSGYQELDLNAIWSNATTPINSVKSNTSNTKASLDSPEIITILNPNKRKLAGEGMRDKQTIDIGKK